MARLLNRAKKWYRQSFVDPITHLAVVRAVEQDGRLTARFAFMAVLSGAIAVLGLLLSSPAVVIGAMLLSPLMGPIMALGFALCILDLDLLKESMVSILCGMALVLGISYGIVFFSPITDATPEILARTQPNLFDLLVAIFAGLAGGYAAIRRKGEAIVGVAIATALLPPLAVVGYGLATRQWNVTHGAALLFMTNLLAIALSVTMLAKWYGFGRRHSAHHTLWQAALVLIVFGALSLPLGLALRNIAYKAYITKTAQAILDDTASADDCRMAQFSIAFPQGKPVLVRATLLTRRYLPEADKKLEIALRTTLKQPVTLDIDQLIVAHAEENKVAPQQIAIASNPLAAPGASAPAIAPPAAAPSSPDAAILAYAKDTLALPIKAQQVEADSKRMTLVVGHEHALSARFRRTTEKTLEEHFPGWTVHLVPESADVPPPAKAP